MPATSAGSSPAAPVLRAANPGVGSPRRSPSERKEARHANAGQDDVRVLRAEMRQTQRPARKSLGFKKPIEKDRISSVALTARIRRSAFEPSTVPLGGRCFYGLASSCSGFLAGVARLSVL